jgi:hypothetical protein
MSKFLQRLAVKKKALLAEEALAKRLRRDEIAACAYCQQNKGKMHPPHFASPGCQSGHHNHCTCDVCF